MPKANSKKLYVLYLESLTESGLEKHFGINPGGKRQMFKPKPEVFTGAPTAKATSSLERGLSMNPGGARQVFTRQKNNIELLKDEINGIKSSYASTVSKTKQLYTDASAIPDPVKRKELLTRISGQAKVARERYLTKMKELSSKMNPKVAAGVGVAAATIGAGILLWKKYHSDAYQYCKDKPGAERGQCMSDYKKSANIARINVLRTAIPKCSKDPDPAGCQQKLQKEIAKLQSRVGG